MATMDCKIVLDQLSDSEFVKIYQWKIDHPSLFVSTINPNLSGSGVLLETETVAGLQSLHDLLAQISIPAPPPIYVPKAASRES